MISGRSCADGGDAVNYSVTALTANTATLSTTPSTGCLNAGDDVLIINLQGTSTNTTNVGNYELLTVQSVSTNTVTFTLGKTKYFGNGASDDTNLGTATSNQRVMLQRVPAYTNITVNNGVALTASVWNGTKGGVLAFKANGTVTVTGTISANAIGYRGEVLQSPEAARPSVVSMAVAEPVAPGGGYDGSGVVGSTGTAGTNAVCGGGGGASGGGGAGAGGGGGYGTAGTGGAAGSGGTTGTCSGSAGTQMWAAGATGKFNSSLGFDGSDDYVQLSSASSPNPTTGLTISAWVKASSLANSTNYTIFVKQTWGSKLGFSTN